MAYSVESEITLISRKLIGRDSKGTAQYESKMRTIPCKFESVSQSEFFTAGQAGIAAEGIFVVNPIEYQKELRLIHEGVALKVYRTYRRSMDELELHAASEVGMNG